MPSVVVGADYRSVTDDGNQFAVATRLDAENAEAVLRVVEGDPFDKARQNFLGR